MTVDSVRAGLMVSVRSDSSVAYVRMAGAVDIAGDSELAAAVECLALLAPQTVVMDLADVTFACSTLANFLVRVNRVIPDGAAMVAHGAIPSVRRLLHLTAVDTLVGMRDDLAGAGRRHGDEVAAVPGGAATGRGGVDLRR
jgi:anti-anti-sigma factor